MPARFRLWRAATLLVACVAAACGKSEPDRDLLAEAEYLVLEQRYEEAIPLLRERLVQNPDDAGAHFYLGRCYQEGAEQWLGISAGEFETALQLFLRQGKKTPIERFTELYFEFACHMEQAKSYMYRMLFLLDDPRARHVPEPIRHDELRRALSHYKTNLANMRAVHPDAPELKQFEDQLRLLESAVQAVAPPPPNTGLV